MNNVKKSIGWCDWTINPVKGLCPVGCSYCYARRAYGRNCNATFKDKSIRYDDKVWNGLKQAKPGDRIFVGSTIDLFHPECGKWLDTIIGECILRPKLTFIFLTKCPENLPKEFPDNCWVGASATNWMQFSNAIGYLAPRQLKVKVKFISFEPLLERIQFDMMQQMLLRSTINWLIIGGETQNGKLVKEHAPKIEWIKEIVDAADKASIPVFLKDNLTDIFLPDISLYKWGINPDSKLRQEFPVVKV